MPIIRITGLTPEEVTRMRNIRLAIQNAFKMRFGFEALDTTDVSFNTDPSIATSDDNHVIASVVTKKFDTMSDKDRDAICQHVAFLMEMHGGHTFNEAFPPGHKSMCGDFAPYKVSDFKNPVGNWEHDGPFEIHLRGDVDLRNIALLYGVETQERVVFVGHNDLYPGRIVQCQGGIRFHAGIDQPFGWDYKNLLRIVDSSTSQLVWQNNS